MHSSYTLPHLYDVNFFLFLLWNFSIQDPLVAPCDCKGDTRYLHVQCLQKWYATPCIVSLTFVAFECSISVVPYLHALLVSLFSTYSPSASIPHDLSYSQSHLSSSSLYLSPFPSVLQSHSTSFSLSLFQVSFFYLWSHSSCHTHYWEWCSCL